MAMMTLSVMEPAEKFQNDLQLWKTAAESFIYVPEELLSIIGFSFLGSGVKAEVFNSGSGTTVWSFAAPH